jgi:hypothetical protein
MYIFWPSNKNFEKVEEPRVAKSFVFSENSQSMISESNYDSNRKTFDCWDQQREKMLEQSRVNLKFHRTASESIQEPYSIDDDVSIPLEPNSLERRAFSDI